MKEEHRVDELNKAAVVLSSPGKMGQVLSLEQSVLSMIWDVISSEGAKKKLEIEIEILTTQAGAKGTNVRLFFPSSVWILKVW